MIYYAQEYWTNGIIQILHYSRVILSSQITVLGPGPFCSQLDEFPRVLWCFRIFAK
jgi:hypothetical protein